MKDYASVIGIIALIWGLLVGLIKWIEFLANAIDHHETILVILGILGVELLIPFFGFVAGVTAFVVFFFIGLPFYGIYSLFKKNETIQD